MNVTLYIEVYCPETIDETSGEGVQLQRRIDLPIPPFVGMKLRFTDEPTDWCTKVVGIDTEIKGLGAETTVYLEDEDLRYKTREEYLRRIEALLENCWEEMG